MSLKITTFVIDERGIENQCRTPVPLAGQKQTHMNSRLLLHELLTKACFEALGLSLNDKLQMVQDGAILKSNDYCTITIENPLPYENDRIDSVWFFGDGTIEFHLENECEALNWDDFESDLIEKIIGIINNESCQR